jgi:type II secretory pathway pseudopilin PulG
MNHVDKKHQQGFTIIELTLAMTFISFLLLGIALSIIQIGAIYNKGTTVKEINQASRDINNDMQRTIASSASIILDNDYIQTPSPTGIIGGRLCLGTYSYVWNYAKAIESKSDGIVTYESGNTDPIYLVKVPDPAKLYCSKNGAAPAIKTIRNVDVPAAKELLKPGDHELGLHDLSIVSPLASSVDNSTGQQLFTINYIVGTSKIDALNDSQSACLAPGVPNADPLYCNIQQFSLVVRAGNKVN